MWGGGVVYNFKSKSGLSHTNTHTLTAQRTNLCSETLTVSDCWKMSSVWWLRGFLPTKGSINPDPGRVPVPAQAFSCLLVIYPPCIWCSAALAGQSTAGRSPLDPTQGSASPSGPLQPSSEGCTDTCWPLKWCSFWPLTHAMILTLKWWEKCNKAKAAHHGSCTQTCDH